MNKNIKKLTLITLTLCMLPQAVHAEGWFTQSLSTTLSKGYNALTTLVKEHKKATAVATGIVAAFVAYWLYKKTTKPATCRGNTKPQGDEQPKRRAMPTNTNYDVNEFCASAQTLLDELAKTEGRFITQDAINRFTTETQELINTALRLLYQGENPEVRSHREELQQALQKLNARSYAMARIGQTPSHQQQQAANALRQAQSPAPSIQAYRPTPQAQSNASANSAPAVITPAHVPLTHAQASQDNSVIIPVYNFYKKIRKNGKKFWKKTNAKRD